MFDLNQIFINRMQIIFIYKTLVYLIEFATILNNCFGTYDHKSLHNGTHGHSQHTIFKVAFKRRVAMNIEQGSYITYALEAAELCSVISSWRPLDLRLR